MASKTHLFSKTISYLAYAVSRFITIENKNAIINITHSIEIYSTHKNLTANKNQFIILISLNILNMLLNSNSGANLMIPCPRESLLLALSVIDLSIYRIRPHSKIGTNNI